MDRKPWPGEELFSIGRFMHSTGFDYCGQFRIFAALGFPLAGSSDAFIYRTNLPP